MVAIDALINSILTEKIPLIYKQNQEAQLNLNLECWRNELLF